MFAIIETGGQQFKVTKGLKFAIEKVAGKEGDVITIDRVLLISDNGVKIGTPYIDGAFAELKVIAQTKGPKITTFKMKSKTRYRKTIGHRQNYTKVELLDIKAQGGKPAVKKVEVKEEKPKTPKKPAVKKVAKKKE